jgi:parallel beta-helix repeat protein
MPKKIFYMLFIVLMVICGLATGTAQATAYYVSPDGNDLADGNSWPNAFKTIQKGLDSASDNDTIDVNVGTYYEIINFNGVSCVLRSTDPNDWDVVGATVIDANGLGSTVLLYGGVDANTVFEGFTVKGGLYAGVDCTSGSPTIRKCIIENNNGATAMGVATYGVGSPLITGNIIRNNTIAGVLPFLGQTTPVIKNNLIYDNMIGIYCYASSAGVEIRNNTIVRNSFSGIYDYAASAPTISNCIIWDCNDDLYNCSATYSCIEDVNDANGTGNITSNPCFVDADSNNFHLNANSPCIDKGDPNGNYSGETDIDDEDRVFNGIVDMGADEFYTYGVIYVDTDANGNDDGTSWTDAFNYLQDALDAATSGDEIWVAEGTYYPDDGDSVTEDNRSETFQLIEDVNIYGGFDGTEASCSQRDWAGNVTILDGIIDIVGAQRITSYHVVTGADATIDGFTIKSGNADGTGADIYGAGMYINTCSPTVRNCTFDDHLADASGAGMCIFNSTSSTIENCIFISNELVPSSGGGGGAIFSYQNISVTIKNSVFTGNHASRGGAIYQLAVGSLDISNCLFEDNYAYNIDGTCIGGAIYVKGHPSEDDGPVNLTNCTIVNNLANCGGGVGFVDSDDASITNCIFWDNDATNYDQIYSHLSTLVVSYSDIEDGYAGTGNINSDPNFVDDTDPDGNDNIWMTSDDGLAIDPNSPCIDAANSNDAPTTDILGNSRYDDPNTTNTGAGDPNYYDMGAYEYQG